MKYLITSLIIALFSFSSCKKKELEFKFSGNIKDINSGLNIANAEIRYYTSNLGNNVEALKGNTKTDASGNYEVTIERSKFETLTVKIRKENFFNKDENYSIDDLTSSESNEINYNLSPQSWTKFIFKNASPSNSSDELKIQKVSGKTNCNECCGNETTYYYGSIDTVVYCPNDGDSYMKFYWWVNGNEQNGDENLYNAPFDTTSFTINY